MSLASVSRGRALLAAAVVLAATLPVWAAEPASAARASGASSGAEPTGPLLVWIDAPRDAFDETGLQASLARELGREVSLVDAAAAAGVRVHLIGASQAEVRYQSPTGEQLSRTVELPPDRERAVQVVTWLTVNLVRDEATELLDALRARRKQEAEARAAEQANDEAAADKAAADKATADKAAADKAAADKAAAEAARQKALQDAQPKPARDELLREPLRSIDAAVATPLSFLKDSPKRQLHLQLALGYGDAGGVSGVTASLGALRVRRELLGAALGLGAALVGGSTRGAVVSTGYSQVDGELDGVVMAAGAAVQLGSGARGAVAAAGGAVAGNLTGALLGGGFATARSLHGVGIAGAAAVIRGPSDGILISGGASWSAQHRGVQISGGVNVARDLAGVALAPINVHRRVRGVQLGIINVAEDVDAAIGVISVSKNGRVQPLLWTSLDGSVHLAIKSVAGWAFTQLGGGVDLSEAKVSYDGGVGLHLPLGKSFFLEPGLHYMALLATADASGAPDEQRVLFLVDLGWRAGNQLDLLLGGGVRQTVAGGDGATLAPEAHAGLAFF